MLCAFDLIEVEGRDLRQEPVEHRKQLLAKLVCALFFGYLRSPVLMLLVGAAMSFFGISIDPAVKIYVAENYPTRVRGTGVGISGVFLAFSRSRSSAASPRPI